MLGLKVFCNICITIYLLDSKVQSVRAKSADYFLLRVSAASCPSRRTTFSRRSAHAAMEWPLCRGTRPCDLDPRRRRSPPGWSWCPSRCCVAQEVIGISILYCRSGNGNANKLTRWRFSANTATKSCTRFAFAIARWSARARKRGRSCRPSQPPSGPEPWILWRLGGRRLSGCGKFGKTPKRVQ